MRRPEGVVAAERNGAGHRDAGQLTPEGRVRLDERTLTFHGDRVCDETPAGAQRGPARGEQIGRREAAADEHRIGRVQAREGGGRFAVHDSEIRDAEPLGVAFDEREAAGVALHRDRPGAARGPHPFDRDRAASGPDVPEKLPGHRRERRERRRAQGPPGEQPVVHEGVVRQSGAARAQRRLRAGDAFHGNGMEGLHVREREGSRGSFAHALRRAAQVLQHDDAALAVAVLAEHLRHPRRCRRVVAERKHPHAGLHRGPERRERPSVQGEGLDFGQAPAEARADEAEARGCGMDAHLAGGEVPRQRGPDAVTEGVAGREDAYAPAGTRAQRPGQRGEGARPFEALAAVGRDHREMARSPDQRMCRIDLGAGRGAQAVQPVLADADDGEPGGHAVLADAGCGRDVQVPEGHAAPGRRVLGLSSRLPSPLSSRRGTPGPELMP